MPLLMQVVFWYPTTIIETKRTLNRGLSAASPSACLVSSRAGLRCPTVWNQELVVACYLITVGALSSVAGMVVLSSGVCATRDALCIFTCTLLLALSGEAGKSKSAGTRSQQACAATLQKGSHMASKVCACS
jgi:hypothetical protein